jgi:hypothetical protein
VRLEVEHRRRPDHVALAGHAGRLGEDTGLHRDLARLRVVEVVGVGRRVGQHDARLHAPVEVDQPVDQLGARLERIVAGVEELDLGTEHLGRLLAFAAPSRLDLVEVVPLPPQPRGLATLAEAQAGDHGAVPGRGRQRDGAGRPPDEVPRVGGHN